MLLTLIKDPIQTITSHTKAEDEIFYNKFTSEIKKIYQYEIFKPMMDLVATLCMKGSLTFSVYDRKLFDLDEGNCKTIEGGSINKVLNKFRVNRTYVITIKKITTDVIVHEIAHMMEKEGEFNSLDPFTQNIVKDIKLLNTNNFSLRAAVNQILIEEVKPYPQNQKASELFARFFQILSMSKEVAGMGSEYGYALKDAYDLFPNTIAFLSGSFYNTVLTKIDPNISAISQNYIKPIEKIEHKWSETKASSIHATPEKPKWSKAVKSIKDNPFA
jgi:hypothetical protein